MRKPLELAISIATEGPRKVCIMPLPSRPQLRVPVRFVNGFKVEGDDLMVTLKDNQKVTLGPISAVSAKGNPAPIDGIPQWLSSDPAFLSVVPSADGLSAEVSAVGPLGNGQVTVTADVDVDPGEDKFVPGVVDFTVIASEGVAITVPEGTPVDQ